MIRFLKNIFGNKTQPQTPVVSEAKPILPAVPVAPVVALKTAEVSAGVLARAEKLISDGLLKASQRDHSGAAVCYGAALKIYPGYWRAHLNLGNALGALGKSDESLKHYREAYHAKPAHFATCYNLGFGLALRGQTQEAIPLLQEAIHLKPDFVDAMVMLCDALERMGRHAECLDWYERALGLQPGHTGILSNKALCLEKLERFDEAEHILQRILTHSPDDTLALRNLASLTCNMGALERSLGYFRQLMRLNPDSSALDGYLMNLQFYDKIEQAEVFAEHRRYQQLCQDIEPLSLGERRADAPCRIGFISPDFRTHAVAYFIEPVFKYLDRRQFQVFAYSATPQPDHVTERLKVSCEEWRDIRGVASRAAAEMIAADQIDILIDLAGHTGHNRLDVMAYRPAPVAATWLGYLGTTGMDALDFRIVDVHTDPVGMTEAFHCEQLIRLPHTQWCYQAQPETPAVSPLPALSNGYVTFGSFNQVAKLSDTILNLWADLLLSVDNSRLLVMAIPPGRAGERIVSERIMKAFSDKGVDPARLIFQARTHWKGYFAGYHRADIALDSFPYTGGTTTCDALYMGVPVLSLAGKHSVARSGASMLSNVGLGDWIAEDAAAFLQKGRAFAQDIDGLAQQRAQLRERFVQSPLGNQAAFVADFAEALHQMWAEKHAH